MERQIMRDIKKISIPEYRQVKINKKIDKKGRTRNPRNNKNKIGIWLVALVCIVFLIFSVTLLFSSALIKITPKKDVVVVDGNYTANFNSMKIEKEKELTIDANIKKNVSTKASGEIVIYNSSTNSQVLTQNTRFENTEGKIYRIQKTITISANGSTTAMVYADQAGSDYNMSLSDLTGDFKIPGFKGSPKYTLFFARLKNDIKGGQNGMILVPDDKTLQDIRVIIDSELKETVLKEAFVQKPDNFVLFDNAYSIEYESLPISSAVEGKVKVREKAILYAVLFNKKDIESKISPKLSQNIDKDEVVAENLESLKFTVKNKDVSFKNSGNLLFSLKGQLSMIWQFSEDKLKKDLAGKSSNYITTALTNYPGIKSAEVSIRPFWKRSFPVNENKIIIEKLTP
ncbi:MAG: baseplate J/gp47 family protein [Patescibacteria group bacterium]